MKRESERMKGRVGQNHQGKHLHSQTASQCVHANNGTVSALTIFLFLFVNNLIILCGVAELAPPGISLEM